MKKRSGIDRAVAPVPKAALEAMPTGALLARLQRLRWCEESAETSDLTDAERGSVSGSILFKSDPAWRAAYDDLKRVLAGREHRSSKP